MQLPLPGGAEMEYLEDIHFVEPEPRQDNGHIKEAANIVDK